MTGGIAKVVIFSFTERGTKQNRYIYRKLKMQGYVKDMPLQSMLWEKKAG